MFSNVKGSFETKLNNLFTIFLKISISKKLCGQRPCVSTFFHVLGMGSNG